MYPAEISSEAAGVANGSMWRKRTSRRPSIIVFGWPYCLWRGLTTQWRQYLINDGCLTAALIFIVAVMSAIFSINVRRNHLINVWLLKCRICGGRQCPVRVMAKESGEES